jgi:hypothetical protein
MRDVLIKALTPTRESKAIEFKESFNPASLQDWCEIINVDVPKLPPWPGQLIKIKAIGLLSAVSLARKTSLPLN